MDMDNKTFTCPECGATVELGAHTCPNCGKALIPSMYTNPSGDAPKGLDDKYEMVPGDLWCQKKVLREPVPDEKFINSYTFGPGCWVYLCSRVFWPIAVLGFVLDGCARILSQDVNLGTTWVNSIPIIAMVVIGLAFTIFLLWFGKVARRKRWERMKWKSFAHFRSDENNWNRIGIIAWLLYAAYLVLQIVISIIGVPSPPP
jgi:hypothetical protein